MKKILLFVFAGFLTIGTYAQKADENIDYYKSLENNKELNLTQEQVAKIKKLNKEIAPKFAAIGQDSNLSAREKGQKKRELAVQHKADIMKELTPEQVAIWEKNYGKIHDEQDVKKAFASNIDAKIEQLEKRYKDDEKNIDNDASLEKVGKKERKKALKEQYKKEKQILKDQKEAVKNSLK